MAVEYQRGNEHDAMEDLVEIFERGAAAKSPLNDIRLHVFRYLGQVQNFDLPETQKRIWEDLKDEREKMGKQQPGRERLHIDTVDIFDNWSVVVGA